MSATQLLASVRSLDEAALALAGGADVIDLKEPAAGALGAVTTGTARAVVRRVAGEVLVSATIGDLPGRLDLIGPAVAAMFEAGVDVVKVGFFDQTGRRAILDGISRVTDREGGIVVAVLFADREGDVLAALPTLRDYGLPGVILDTADKRRGSLRQIMTDTALRDIVRAAHGNGLWIGLAGSLAGDDIDPLLPLRPDYLGFRTALCAEGRRETTLDPERLARVRARIPRVVVGRPAIQEAAV
jgi:dihydroneopterin aldolase